VLEWIGQQIIEFQDVISPQEFVSLIAHRIISTFDAGRVPEKDISVYPLAARGPLTINGTLTPPW
jgi:hypothetical protein